MNEKNSPKLQPANDQPQTQVYAVFGAEPEVQAYAMAKYSRSSLSLKESLKEISGQKAEKFLNTFYFQYGHRSIADLAHIAMAVERLSLLAAIVLEDEQRWDGQERSTRYQDFARPDYYTPYFHDNQAAKSLYEQTIGFLFSEYQFFSGEMFHRLVERTPRPEDMKQEQYERTLRARAFDIARYLLPLATRTSLGQIVNARTLESQIARLLSHTHEEVRQLGALLKEAALKPAYNVNESSFRKLVEELKGYDEGLGREAHELLLKDVRVAPTLVKYADPSVYLVETRRELTNAASDLLKDEPIEDAPAVELLEEDPVEIELATTLLYEHCHYPYKQIRRHVEDLPERRRQEILNLGTKHRGPHDELLRAFCVGHKFRFDILMDIGAFRDMHRHRRCTQIHQGLVFAHGFDTPHEIEEFGHAKRYTETMRRVSDAAHRIATGLPQLGDSTDAQYLIPLAYRKRTLFKMDLAEVVYITELRSSPAGHFSYRKIAWDMYRAAADRHPELAPCFRVHDVRQPVDLLKR